MTNWDDIVHEHGPASYRTAWRILGHAQDCEDVLQEVYLEACAKFAGGDVTHWRTFLNRLVTFRALDALRRRRGMDDLCQSTLYDESPGVEDNAIQQEEAFRIRAIVAGLPPRQAAVFCLVHFEELSHVEIADTLEISLNAVAMSLHKAHVRLRRLISEKQPELNQ